MLGKTAKWLRVLGFDTYYDNKASDADLKKLCLAEVRVLLTKDVALHKSLPAGLSRLIAAVRPGQQLEEIVAGFQLDRFQLPPRCSLCNGELTAIAKARVKDMVPPYVFLTQNCFQRCSQCQKIYWPGTHKNKINLFFDKVKKNLIRS